jgi:hypothetical protein
MRQAALGGFKITGCLFRGSVPLTSNSSHKSQDHHGSAGQAYSRAPYFGGDSFDGHFKVGLTSMEHRNRHRVLFEALAVFSCHDSCTRFEELN